MFEIKIFSFLHGIRMGKPAERLCLFNLLNQNPSAPDKSAHNVIISFLWEIPAGIGTNDQERKQDSNLEHEHKNRANYFNKTAEKLSSIL